MAEAHSIETMTRDPDGPPLAMGELTLDALTRDFRIYQRRRGHRTSVDDLLTAWYATRGPTPCTMLDLGTGTGCLLVAAVAILIVLVAGGVGGGFYLWYHEDLVGNLQAHSIDVKSAAKQLDIPLANQAAIACRPESVISNDFWPDSVRSDGTTRPSRSRRSRVV